MASDAASASRYERMTDFERFSCMAIIGDPESHLLFRPGGERWQLAMGEQSCLSSNNGVTVQKNSYSSPHPPGFRDWGLYTEDT